MPAGICAEVPARAPSGASLTHTWPVRNFDLAATLESGQVFRWTPVDGGWEGIVAGRWVRLQATTGGLAAECCVPQTDWDWLGRWLRVEDDLAAILATFPDDPPLQAAVAAWRGLRLLRQEPWECLASFILSSTKQIAHIRGIVATLCRRDGGRDLRFPPPRGWRPARKRNCSPAAWDFARRICSRRPGGWRAGSCDWMHWRVCRWLERVRN